MSTSNSTQDTRKFILTLVFSLIGATGMIAILALVFALADINVRGLCFSLDKGASLIGIMVSAIGIVITGYFVVLAIDAYSHVKRLSELSNKADAFESKYKLHEEKMQNLSDFYLDYLYNDLNDRIAAIGAYGSGQNKNALLKEKKNLMRKRAKLAILFPDMKYDLFCKLINDLGAIGDKTDLKELKEYEKTVQETDKLQQVKKVIKSIVDRISDSLT